MLHQLLLQLFSYSCWQNDFLLILGYIPDFLVPSTVLIIIKHLVIWLTILSRKKIHAPRKLYFFLTPSSSNTERQLLSLLCTFSFLTLRETERKSKSKNQEFPFFYFSFSETCLFDFWGLLSSRSFLVGTILSCFLFSILGQWLQGWIRNRALAIANWRYEKNITSENYAMISYQIYRSREFGGSRSQKCALPLSSFRSVKGLSFFFLFERMKGSIFSKKKGGKERGR